jgi:hypothetical protein
MSLRVDTAFPTLEKEHGVYALHRECNFEVREREVLCHSRSSRFYSLVGRTLAVQCQLGDPVMQCQLFN